MAALQGRRGRGVTAILVVPFALRRWRNHPLSAAAWREMSTFRHDLRRDRYSAVLDVQEQLKGALIALLARGVRHGPDRASICEPIATLAHDVHHAIDPNPHLIDRCRQLAAAALGYRAEGPPRFGLVAPPVAASGVMPDQPYMIFLHATSRADKLWPEASWRTLIGAFVRRGSPCFCYGERPTSRRAASGLRQARLPRATSAESGRFRRSTPFSMRRARSCVACRAARSR